MKTRLQFDEKLITWMASVASLSAFFYFLRTQEILLYGDAVAHINIARRVVDSLTPGPLQLGTVWLPLPHLLMLPFVAVDRLWQSGIAGSFVSMLAYVLGAVGIFRLVSMMASRIAAWTAAAVFALNPNLLYLQSTAMTESIFLAALVWSCAYFVGFVQAMRERNAERNAEQAGIALQHCAIALAAACLTRYDGWWLTAFAGVAVLSITLRAEKSVRVAIIRPLRNFTLLTALTPALWLAYNFGVYGNALEFATGPYSARAIAEHSTKNGDAPHPGFHDLKTANSYFIKAAKLNMGEGRIQHWLFALSALAGLIAVVDKRFRPALLLWVPWPFYVLSIAYGGVPIFMPVWWPFSYYNVRYGLQLLPAIAVFTAIFFEVLRRVNWNRAYVRIVTLASLALIAASYLSVWRAVPICLREARVNATARLAFERTLSSQLSQLPENAKLMMYTGNHPGTLQQAAIPFRRVLNEGNYRQWDAALYRPSESADYIIAQEGDPVANAVAKNPSGLYTMVVVHTKGQPRAVIYKSANRK